MSYKSRRERDFPLPLLPAFWVMVRKWLPASQEEIHHQKVITLALWAWISSFPACCYILLGHSKHTERMFYMLLVKYQNLLASVSACIISFTWNQNNHQHVWFLVSNNRHFFTANTEHQWSQKTTPVNRYFKASWSFYLFFVQICVFRKNIGGEGSEVVCSYSSSHLVMLNS